MDYCSKDMHWYQRRTDRMVIPTALLFVWFCVRLCLDSSSIARLATTTITITAISDTSSVLTKTTTSTHSFYPVQSISNHPYETVEDYLKQEVIPPDQIKRIFPVDNYRHDNRQQQEQQQNISCIPTESIRLTLHKTQRDNNNNNNIQLQLTIVSLDRYGNIKTTGGDEYSVGLYSTSAGKSKSERATATALTNDLKNGHYELTQFIQTTPDTPNIPLVASPHVIIRIYLQYTCGMSAMDIPTKDSWNTGGHLAKRFDFDLNYLDNVLLPVVPYSTFLQQKHSAAAPSFSWNDFDRILLFGDSLMQHIAWAMQDRPDLVVTTSLQISPWILKKRAKQPKTQPQVKQSQTTIMPKQIHKHNHMTTVTTFKKRKKRSTVGGDGGKEGSKKVHRHDRRRLNAVTTGTNNTQRRRLPHFFYPENVFAPLNMKTLTTRWIPEFLRYYDAKSTENIMNATSATTVTSNDLQVARKQIEEEVEEETNRQNNTDDDNASTTNKDDESNDYNPSWAIVVGSSAWDLLEPESYHEVGHLDAIRRFLHFLRDEFIPQQESTCNNVTIIWKSPTAMHVHRTYREDEKKQKKQGNDKTGSSLPRNTPSGTNITNNNVELEERIRYMSTSRTFELYRLQKQLITTEFPDVMWMDWYWPSALAADWTFPGDGRHYVTAWNQQMMLQWTEQDHDRMDM
ncbi:hypothetical protein IV203_025094 [Nitzschia inconspicua]|uniref:Uncharacterized protein n=1 Tax=Nitzschia inconspicua TaxID=303405 RepID=A0A9K3P9M2_9STRA|nr:hypothetical protein IV203_025161 [Nitzschia inconspicua]KAG7365653.1 hypothetical protein IV203_025094 [Nitzschia inconspicua]